jgi:hypothetical protein
LEIGGPPCYKTDQKIIIQSLLNSIQVQLLFALAFKLVDAFREKALPIMSSQSAKMGLALINLGNFDICAEQNILYINKMKQ